MGLMRLGKRLLVASLFLLPVADAKELYGPEAGVVPFGMGRAYSAVADDWLALHYNPAGLAMVNRVDLQLFDLRVGSNRDVIDSYDNIKNLSDKSKGIAATLNQYAGKHVMAEVSNHSQITVPHFAIGLGYNVHADIDMQNTAYPVTMMRYTRDFSVSLGAAAAFGKRKDLRVGGKVAIVQRRGGSRRVGIDEIAGNRETLVDLFKQTGSGIAGTFGLQYRLPTTGRTEVTTSFVWHDIGETAFGSHMDQNRPSRINQNIVVGTAVRFPIGGRKNRRLERRYGSSRSTNHLTFAFDYSHLNYGMDTEHFPKHIHLGMNLDLPILSIQAGLNQTSLTFGTSFDIGILRVAVATYGEELGSYAGQRRDRRYLLSVGSNLGFKGF
jgi:hypothetical protein